MADNLWLQKELEDAETDRIAGDVVRTGAQFSPARTPVSAQVDQLRGDDDFQARFNSTTSSFNSMVPPVETTQGYPHSSLG